MAISRADIEAILAEFETSDWRSIQLKADGIELSLSKDGIILPALSVVAAPQQSAGAMPVTENRLAPDDGNVVVKAASLGSFYRAPKPGAAPFITEGAHVEAGDDLCLIEVMKLFTSVNAPISGVVTAILASDGDLVEHGQALFLIKPDA